MPVPLLRRACEKPVPGRPELSETWGPVSGTERFAALPGNVGPPQADAVVTVAAADG